MKAAVLVGPDQLEVRDVPDPIDRSKALVSLETVGICGTDVSILRGKIAVRYPRILGHELVGRVLRPAENGSVQEGTRVLINPSIACGRCNACRADRDHLCPNGGLVGRDCDGGFAEFIAVDDTRLVPVPASIPSNDAALLQVLGTCIHAHDSFAIYPGQTAAVVGLGVAGFLMVQLLRARGAAQILGVTRSPDKQELASRLGATRVVAPEGANEARDELTDGAGFDIVIEAAGTIATLGQAIELAAPAGVVVGFGIIRQMGTCQSSEVGLPLYELYQKELTLIYPRAARHRDYARSIELARSGQVELGPLWSAAFPLAAVADALTAAQDPTKLKVNLDLRLASGRDCPQVG